MVPLCSRNAHDQNVLVRRAQWGNQSAHDLQEEGGDRGLGDFGSASIDVRSMRAENAKRQTFDTELNFEAK